MLAAALPPPRHYLPFEDGPFRMAMALQAIAEDAWIELDADYPAHITERRRLLETQREEVLAGLPGSEAMCAELLDMLADALVRHHPQWFSRSGGRLRNALLDEDWALDCPDTPPLAIAGRLVQEDFCLLRLDPEGPHLVAAVLCFPSRWRLSEKLGRPLAPIHGQVPFYGERLARPVDRFMASLRPGRVAMRLNWSIMDDAALFQQGGHFHNDAAPAGAFADIGRDIVLRVERQTFRALPQSGGVVFGIRIHVTPLAEAITTPADAARLAAAVEALPPDMARYKSILPFRAALLDWLRARAG